MMGSDEAFSVEFLTIARDSDFERGTQSGTTHATRTRGKARTLWVTERNDGFQGNIPPGLRPLVASINDAGKEYFLHHYLENHHHAK
jgi:hypothetical protein